MKFLLDANAWIANLRRNNQALIARLEAEPPANLATCSVVVGELYYGAWRGGIEYRAANLQLVEQLRTKFPSLPFDDAAAYDYGRIRAELTAAGTLIGHNDLMIAAIALSNNFTLVTHNTREFNRVPGLKLEDWQST